MFTCLFSEFTSISPAGCGSFPLLTHRTCLPFFYLFSPQFPIFLLNAFVLPNIMYFLATSLHFTLPCGFMLFSIIYIHIYFLSPTLSHPPSRAALFNLIYHLTSFIPSPPLTHTIASVSSLSPSTITSNPPLPPHWDTRDK